MPLAIARQKLLYALEELWPLNPIPAQGRLLAELTHEWYVELKKFEGEETFSNAFTQNRMTMRLLNADPSRSANDYKRDVESHKVEKQRDGSFKKVGEIKQVYLSGGLEGMKDRMNPDSFSRPDPDPSGVRGQSEKNGLGLHDLSARLLDGRFDIGKQGFKIEKVKHAVFMPVPPEEDHELFYKLNLSAKGELSHASEFVQEISFIRARLTRIKLAEPTDMGSSLIVMESPGNRQRIRYGYTGVVSKPPQAVVTEKSFEQQIQEKMGKLKPVTNEWPEDVALTAEQIRKRVETAWRYKCVLKTTWALGNNEIVIAYRQCNNTMFPLVTNWPDLNTAWNCYEIQSGPLAGKHLYNNGTIK